MSATNIYVGLVTLWSTPPADNNSIVAWTNTMKKMQEHFFELQTLALQAKRKLSLMMKCFEASAYFVLLLPSNQINFRMMSEVYQVR